MIDFFTTYNEQIFTGVISFVVALGTTLITHLLSNFKLRYTEKLKITSELSKKKYEGITKIRGEITILSHYENLCITEDEEYLIPENIGQKQYTPSCCYSYDSLINTASTLNDLHIEYGHCLRHTSVIYLVYIRNFLMDYAFKCKQAGLADEELRWASLPLYSGIHKWYKLFDKELIKCMNKPSTKYYAHSGLIYKSLLKIYGWYFIKTKPYKYMNDENSLLNQIINNRDELIEQYYQTILNNSEKK